MDVPFTSDKRAKKRARYSNAKGGDGDGKKGDNALPAPEPITSAKHLQQLLSITDSTALQHGMEWDVRGRKGRRNTDAVCRL